MSEIRRGPPPSKPTHNVCVKLNGRKSWEKIGAGWINEHGAIYIKLNPLIDLHRMQEGEALKIFPVDYFEDMKKKAGQHRPPAPPTGPPQFQEEGPDFGDDDIPF